MVETRSMLRCDEVREELIRLLASEIECQAEGGMLRLDTPYIIGDGYLMRAYLSPVDERIRVTDRGFATSQVEMYVTGSNTLLARYDDLNEVARKCGIRWEDGEFTYESDSIQDAMMRLKLLAQAMQEA